MRQRGARQFFPGRCRGDAGLFDGAQGGFGGQIGGEFVFGGDAAFLDAGPGCDPFVGGVDQLFKLGVGKDLVRDVGADGQDGAGAALEIMPGARVFKLFFG
jgi:hypothetical protein